MSERLVDFLYILLRDHMLGGDLEEIMLRHVSSDQSIYCNPFLEGYARDLARRLTDDSAPYHEWGPNYRGPDDGFAGSES